MYKFFRKTASNNVSPIDPTQPSPVYSRPLSYAPAKTQKLCAYCKARPTAITPDGREHAYCGRTCAQKDLHPITTVSLGVDLCLGCGMHPKNTSGGRQHQHCSRTCAHKWPQTNQVCALSSCTTCITGAFGAYCSAAHLDQQKQSNKLLKKRSQFTSPPPPVQRAPLSAQPLSGYYSAPSPIRHFSRSNPIQPPAQRRILFYDKNVPYYGFTNFSNHPVVFENKKYLTSEHLFQAFKFLGHRPDIAEHLRTFSRRPMDVYNEARKFDHEKRSDWLSGRINIEKMKVALKLKFTQHESLRDELLSTGDAVLVEDSPTDPFWGIGHDGQGQNMLGLALMELREELRASSGSNFLTVP